MSKIILFYLKLCLFLFISFNSGDLSVQEIDSDELLDRLDRVERNISDLQKGLVGEIDKNLTSGYISRNESRLDLIESQTQKNFGLSEELENRLKDIESKLDLINNDFSIRFDDIENQIFTIQNQEVNSSEILQKNQGFEPKLESDIGSNALSNDFSKNEETIDPKKRYENAINLLWSNDLDEALKELMILKKLKPENLMPNIQYWLGEVYYAKKNFDQAIIEFGEGLKSYPDSIKGPDNMLKLGLSFSNLKKKKEACNVLIELELKYSSASKDVIQRSVKERKNLDCPKE